MRQRWRSNGRFHNWLLVRVSAFALIVAMFELTRRSGKEGNHMYFMLRDGWYCQFLEQDLKTSLPRKLTFSSAEKVKELAERGGAFKDLADHQSFEHGVSIGRGGVYLKLTREQYAVLKRI
jgi:hypothetical protein